MCVEITFITIGVFFLWFWKRKQVKLNFKKILAFILTVRKKKWIKKCFLLFLHLFLLWGFCTSSWDFFYNNAVSIFNWRYFNDFLIISILSNGFFILFIKNAIIGLMLLIVFFLNSAILLIFLSLKYVGLNLILIYLGAILILFVFVLMLLNATLIKKAFFSFLYKLLTAFFGLKIVFAINFAFKSVHFFSKKENFPVLSETANISEDAILISNSLYTFQLNNLLLATIILFIALVVSVTITTFKN